MRYYLTKNECGVIKYQTSIESGILIHDITNEITVATHETDVLCFTDIQIESGVIELNLNKLDDMLSSLSSSLRFRAIDQLYFWYKSFLDKGYQLAIDYDDNRYSSDNLGNDTCSWLFPFTCMQRLLANTTIAKLQSAQFKNLHAFIHAIQESQQHYVLEHQSPFRNSILEENEYRYTPSSINRQSKTKSLTLLRDTAPVEHQQELAQEQQQEQQQKQQQKHNHLQTQQDGTSGFDLWSAWQLIQLSANNEHQFESRELLKKSYAFQVFPTTDRFGIINDEHVAHIQWLQEIAAKKTIDSDIMCGLFSLGNISELNPLNVQQLSYQKPLELPNYSINILTYCAGIGHYAKRAKYLEDGLSPYRQHCIESQSLFMGKTRALVTYDNEPANIFLNVKQSIPLFTIEDDSQNKFLITMNGVYTALFKTINNHEILRNDAHATFLYQQYHLHANESINYAETMFHLIAWIKQQVQLSAHAEQLITEWLNSRLLSKLAAENEVQGDSERRTAVYASVHEDSSTESTQQFASAVEFRKKSSRENCELKRDTLRVILHPFLLRNISSTLNSILQKLMVMKSAALLDAYFVIHVEHATNVSSLSTVLFDEENSLIFALANQPNILDIKDTRSFIFTKHFLLYAAKNHIQIGTLTLDDIFTWYRKIEQNIDSYAQNEEQASHLKERFFTNICTSNGLSLAPVKLATTFFEGLLAVIKHAISQHCLEEQIECLEGISVAWRDAPYALSHNGYKLAHKKMNLVIKNLDPLQGCYTVLTPAQLKLMCINNYDKIDELNEAILRYLGTTSLAASFSNYQLLTRIFEDEPPQNRQMNTVLLVMFVLLTTGSNEGLSWSMEALQSKVQEWFVSHQSFAQALQAHLPSVMHCFNAIQSQKNELTSIWKIYQTQQPQQAQPQANVLSSIFSMLSFTSTPATESIPAIFTKLFFPQNLYQFLKKNQAAILEQKEFLQTHSTLPYTIFIALLQSHAATLKCQYSVLNSIASEYQHVSIENLYDALDNLQESLVAYAKWTSSSTSEEILHLVSILMQRTGLRRTGITLNILSQQLMLINQSENSLISTVFLDALSKNIQILNNMNTVRTILPIIVEFYLRTQPEQRQLQKLLQLCKIALDTSNPTGAVTIILTHFRSSAGQNLWCKPNRLFNNIQLENITRLIEHTEKAIPWIDWCLDDNPNRDFKLLIPYIDKLSPAHFEAMLDVIMILLRAKKLVSDTELNAICLKPSYILNYACTILKQDSSYNIEQASNIILQVIQSPNPRTLLEELEEKFLNSHQSLPIDDLDFNDAQQQLSLITSTEDDETFIPKRDALYAAFLKTMIYCKTTRFLNNRGEQVLLRNLNRTSCITLYHYLAEQMLQQTTPEEQAPYLEQLLALCCVVVFRITNQFPRPMQCMAVLNSQTNLHALPTGSGKSLIIVLYAMLDNAKGNTPDILTQNAQLASNALRVYSDCYAYLDIPFAAEPIDATDSKALYRKGQIHYLTFENRVFFACQQDLRNFTIHINERLLIDEVDLILNTPVMCRLAANIGRTLTQKQWNIILQMIVDFVKNKKLFIDNLCSAEDDIHNLKLYLKTRIASLPTETNQLLSLPEFSDNDYDELIDSAQTANALVENEDFVILNKTKTTVYAAPILKQTDRPSLSVSYGGYTQIFLHMSLKKKYPSLNFEECTKQDVILIVHPSALLKWTPQTSFAGFSGTLNNTTAHGLSLFRYPNDNLGRITELQIRIAKGVAQHQHFLANFLTEWREAYNQHSILVFLPSPEAVYTMKQALHYSGFDNIDSYEGFDNIGSVEQNAIIRAGQKGSILLTTMAWARGIDILPQEYLTVVNGCVKLDEDIYQQIKGRTGRNGRPGVFISIIDVDGLDFGTDDTNIIANWAIYRQQLLTEKQTEISRIKEFETLRHKVVFKHYIQRIKEAKSVLLPWHGYQYSILQNTFNPEIIRYLDKDLLRWLHELNKKIESCSDITPRQLYNARSQPFLDILKCLDDNIITLDKRPIEWLPLIKLANYDNLTIKDISLLSGVARLHEGIVGFKSNIKLHQFLDATMQLIQECVDGKSSIISTLIKMYATAMTSDGISLKEKLQKPVAFLKNIPEMSTTNHMALVQTAIEQDDWDAVFLHTQAWLRSQYIVINSIGWITSIMKYYPSVNLRNQGEIIEHMQRIVGWLLYLEEPLNHTLKDYLDVIAPLINQTTLENMLSIASPAKNMQILIDTILTSFNVLRLYNNLTLRECLEHQQLLKIVLHICCMPIFRNNLDNITQHYIAPFYDLETLNRVLLFKHIPLTDFLYLLKTLSHPLMHTLITSLPPTASVRELSGWVSSKIDSQSQALPRPFFVDKAFKELAEAKNNAVFSRTQEDWVTCFSLHT